MHHIAYNLTNLTAKSKYLVRKIEILILGRSFKILQLIFSEKELTLTTIFVAFFIHKYDARRFFLVVVFTMEKYGLKFFLF